MTLEELEDQNAPVEGSASEPSEAEGQPADQPADLQSDSDEGVDAKEAHAAEDAADEDAAAEENAIGDSSESGTAEQPEAENGSEEPADREDNQEQDEPEEKADSAEDAKDDSLGSGDSAVEENSSDDASSEEASTDIQAADIPKRKGSTLKKTLLIIAAAVLIIIAGCCVALAADDNSRTQMVPEKTTLDGKIDVTGMTQDELSQVIKDHVANDSVNMVNVNVNGNQYSVDLLDVGALKVEDTVAQAFSPYNTNIFSRWGSRIVEFATGNTGNYQIYTMFDIDHDALATRVGEIANDAYTDPQNAGYSYDGETNSLVATAPVDGVSMDAEATTAAIEKSIVKPTDYSMSRFAVDAPVTVTQPDVLEPGQAIFVDTRNCYVYLYEDGAEVASYACTPGQSGYATPKGNFYLEYKDSAPTWINPHSDWSANMAETIPPGPSNPLGLRALAVSCGGGIYIHGTTNTGGLGAPGSHGCIRLSNSNIVELYDRVSTGIPIIIR